ncbi:MAG: single-stranded-DNA-specific exonuclease RecJ [Chloroflexi bacterium]|nr:single-stranded-DNA-specific exonuclease RecJ [Chloroflexota bacterium]
MATEWRPLPSPPQGFADSLALPSLQAQLLYNRDIRTRPEVEAFLAVDERFHHDPMLLPDMERGAARLQAALQSGERVGIFGDFDADGVTGTALLSQALGELGLAVVSYLPDRVDEGHGLSEQGIRSLREQGVSVLVTVDCGVSSEEEVRMAASLGMETIITDHHVLGGTLPEACAVISHARSDSSYPYPYLTGAGVALKLAEALFAQLGRPSPDHLLGLAAIGTVGDLGPLMDENRYIVKHGLDRLNEDPGVGLRALMASAGLEPGSLDTEALSFKLIPRLNAAGRMGQAGLSLDLLTATEPEVAGRLAGELESKNAERQVLTSRCVDEALGQVDAVADSEDGLPSMLFVGSQTWPPGVLGLIAGRLADRFHRPTVALCFGPDVSRASARSIDGFDIVGALEPTRDLLVRFGGHRQAAGFTVPTAKLHTLQRRLQSLAEESLAGLELTPAVEIDAEVPPEVTAERDNFRFIQSLAPFGKDNRSPVFLGRGIQVLEARSVGRGSRHLKLRVSSGDGTWDAIAFGRGEMAGDARGRVDLVYTIGLDDWGGLPRIQLKVLDLRRAV